MILLDTNVLIYAFDLDSPFCQWARETIVNAVAGDGAAINAVSIINSQLEQAKAAQKLQVVLPDGAADLVETIGGEEHCEIRAVESEAG